MSTFLGSNGTMAMFMAVAEQVDRIDALVDVHTVTLVLNGQHGEFDLIIEATDSVMEDRRWEGIAHRTGGVTALKAVTV
jgi:hypothetical protein